VSAYQHLAAHYDRLTEDVDYQSFADRYEALITRDGRRPELVLDLACGTGTLTNILASRGYQMIGTDASAEMLTCAREKAGEVLYLHQSLQELDLYGTVDAAICTLDSLNYIPPEDLAEVFRRVFLFLNPGGVFAFDLHTPEKLMGLDGQLFCDERADLLCLWRCSYDEERRTCSYEIDLFTRENRAQNHWSRQRETQIEYAHMATEVQAKLEQSGFCEVDITQEEGRIFFAAICSENDKRN